MAAEPVSNIFIGTNKERVAAAAVAEKKDEEHLSATMSDMHDEV